MKRALHQIRKGFTLVEIMIVVLIIGILLAIAVPNFVSARNNSRIKSCVGNLRQVDGAKQQWAMDNQKTGADTPGWADLTPGYIRSQPSCPSGGTYTMGNIDTFPTCNQASHTL